MPAVTFHFHADLMDFLPKEYRQVDLQMNLKGHETVKHLIESLGIPHTEVDVILANGVSVDFAFQPVNADEVDVFPVQILIDNSIRHLQPVFTGEPRFVLDGHLGKLACYLRLMGFDVLYRNDYDDSELAEISSRESRILLTRDRGLLKRSEVAYGYCVRGKYLQNQIVEVLHRYDLIGQVKPFSRCARCNGMLTPVSKVDVIDRLEPKTKLYYDDFRRCNGCDQIYWKGSHFEHMEKDIFRLLELARGIAKDARY
jgi:uncharacterized protein